MCCVFCISPLIPFNSFPTSIHLEIKCTPTAFPGFRERLHGHNYKVAVRVLGSRQIAPDGYVLDFGDVKKVTRKVCKELNEHFICPMLSNVMDVSIVENGGGGGETVILSCEDGSVFQFPKQDCALLPIVHSTAEEMAIYLWSRILKGLSAEYLLVRGIHTIEITVSEATGQEAIFRHEIPKDGEGNSTETPELDIKSFIMEGDVPVAPCLPDTTATKKATTTATQGSNDGCQNCTNCLASLSGKLEALALSLRDRTSKSDITADDLMEMLKDK